MSALHARGAGPVRRWRALGGMAALAVLLLLLAGLWRAATMPPTPAPDGDAVLRWQTGTAQRYALQMDSTLQAGGAAAGPPTVVRLQAGLNMRTLSVGADAVQVGLQFDDVVLHVDGQRDAGREAALGTPLRVHFSPGGMRQAFEFPAAASHEDRIMLENLVRTFQVTLQAGETAWQARERGVSGDYVAVYRRAAGNVLTKTKGSFDAPDTGPMAGATLSSQEVVRLDPRHDWLQSMTVEETLRAGSAGTLAMTVRQRAVLSLHPAAPVAVPPEVWAFAAAGAAPQRPVALPVPRLSAASARAEMLARVRGLDVDRAQRAVHIRRLGALARVDPQLPALIVDQLRSGGLADATRAELFLVLEIAGTAAAQSALASLTQDADWAVADRSRAVVALGGLDDPQPQALDTLWAMAAQAAGPADAAKLAGDATFALGRLGRTMHDAGHPGFPLLRQRLLNGALAGGSTPAEDRQRANHLLALGNLRDASLTGDVGDMLDDASPVVRRAAAQALGALAIDAAAERLLDQLRAETSAPVRSAIAESLRHWTAPTPQAMQTLRTVLPREHDERTRHAMTTLLGTHLAQHPDNAAALRALLRTEPSRRIRQVAADALAEAGRR